MLRKAKPYTLSKSGEIKLASVHPILQEWLRELLWYKDFSIIETARSIEKQKENVAKGVSKTLNSKHIVDESGYAKAVDIYPYPIPRLPNGEIDSKSKAWNELADAGLKVAGKLGIDNLTWGGFWTSLVDKPHWEI